MYDSAEQAQLRLGQTIVGYDGKPVYVHRVNKAEELECSLMNRMEALITVALNDPKLNINKFPLGYVNVRNRAVYLSRSPMRQQRQGLCRQNVLVKNAAGVNFLDVAKTPGFVDAWTNVYPTIKDCLNQFDINPDLKSMAFNRRWALYQDKDLGFFELLYRGERVAWGDPQGFVLPSEYSYLRESLAECGVNIR